MPALSIIVPVYNVELYLKECIDSILNQKFTDFELILVDDGSTDRSGSICDDYAGKDSRIKVIHQKNQGVSTARNAALDIAAGKYLGFVDADDYIEPDMYQELVGKAEEYCADAAICAMNYVDEDGGYRKSHVIGADGILTQDCLIKECFSNDLLMICCNKILLRAPILDIREDSDLTIAEDYVYLFRCLLRLGKGIKISKTLYNVRERHNSASRNDQVKLNYKRYIVEKPDDIVLNLARKTSGRIEAYATDRYLDDCVRYSSAMRDEAIAQRKPYFRVFLYMRLKMFKVLVSAFLRRVLPAEKIRGYLYNLIMV